MSNPNDFWTRVYNFALPRLEARAAAFDRQMEYARNNPGDLNAVGNSDIATGFTGRERMIASAIATQIQQHLPGTNPGAYLPGRPGQ